jgi:hypothetical protein
VCRIDMRGLETLTLASLVGLVGVGIWQGGKWLPALVSHEATAAISPLNRNVPKELHHSASKTSRSGNPKTDNRRASNTAASPTQSGAPIVIYVPPPAVPNQSNCAPGATRSQLREQYGEPALSVVSRRDGRLVEQYYYNADQTHFVVATLHDGTVAFAETIDRLPQWRP